MCPTIVAATGGYLSGLLHFLLKNKITNSEAAAIGRIIAIATGYSMLYSIASHKVKEIQ